jgi:hypothetical protein
MEGRELYEGKIEKKLDKAFKSAWDVAKERGNTRTTLQAERILVHGHNPITGYSIVLSPWP